MPKIYSNPFFNSSFVMREKVHKKRTFIKNHYLCIRVHLIRRETLEAYGKLNPMARNALEAFLSKVKYADWSIPSDIQKTFKDADIIGRGANRIIFNINGNRFRLICKYVFGAKQVHLFVCWIGSHPEYDFICSTGRQYTINIF